MHKGHGCLVILKKCKTHLDKLVGCETSFSTYSPNIYIYIYNVLTSINIWDITHKLLSRCTLKACDSVYTRTLGFDSYSI